MPNDVITLKAVVLEFIQYLIKARIEKIYQPETDEISLKLKAGPKRHMLTISSNVNLPNIRMTQSKKQNPLIASGFCVLLRKHLG